MINGVDAAPQAANWTDARLGIRELHVVRLLWLSLWEGGKGSKGEYKRTQQVVPRPCKWRLKVRLRLASAFIISWSNFIIT